MTLEVFLADLGNRIAAQPANHPLRVAIDGIDGAGKTLFADGLACILGSAGRSVIRASIDGFHNPAWARNRQGPFSAPGYYQDSFDYEKAIGWLLQPLGPGGNRLYRRAAFDYRTDRPVHAVPATAPANAILLMDGVFLLRPELRAYWDFSIFLRVHDAVARTRLLHRDGTEPGLRRKLEEKWRRRYLPGQQLYFREASPERQASLVVDNNDWEHPFLVKGTPPGANPGFAQR